MLRAAAIGGGAYVAGQRRQQAVQQREPAPSPALGPAAPTDQVAQLKQLADLHANGVLTDDEFSAQKAKVLGS